VIQLAPVAPQLEQMARGDAVRVRRDVRAGVRRPVPGVARGDSSRMLVPLGTFPLEDDVPAGKSNGELFPTARFRAGYGCFFTNSASDAV
jgi:hypothetical protein